MKKRVETMYIKNDFRIANEKLYGKELNSGLRFQMFIAGIEKIVPFFTFTAIHYNVWTD